MKVSELIEKLQQYSPDADVLVAVDDAYPRRYEELSVDQRNLSLTMFYGDALLVDAGRLPEHWEVLEIVQKVVIE